MTIIRTQGKHTGHGWYNHLFYSPSLGKGVVKRLHGDEPWWPTRAEAHNVGDLLADIASGKTEKELKTEWHSVCFYETPDFNESRDVSYNVDGILETV